VHTITRELLFKANNVWAVFAPGLQLDFSGDLRLAFVRIVAVWDHFDGELLAAASMLCEHHPAECAFTQFFY